jgi:hypothetical protein
MLEQRRIVAEQVADCTASQAERRLASPRLNRARTVCHYTRLRVQLRTSTNPLRARRWSPFLRVASLHSLRGPGTTAALPLPRRRSLPENPSPPPAPAHTPLAKVAAAALLPLEREQGLRRRLGHRAHPVHRRRCRLDPPLGEVEVKVEVVAAPQQ